MEKEKKLPVRAVGFGTAAAMGVYLLLLALTAYLTVSGRVGETRTEHAVWLCACLASFVGAWTAAGVGGRGSAPLLASAAFWAVPVLFGALSGEESWPHRALFLFAAAAVGTLLASALMRGRKGKRGRRRRTANARR